MWLLLRTTSTRWFSLVPKINVLSKNIKNIFFFFFSIKFFNFYSSRRTMYITWECFCNVIFQSYAISLIFFSVPHCMNAYLEYSSCSEFFWSVPLSMPNLLLSGDFHFICTIFSFNIFKTVQQSITVKII